MPSTRRIENYQKINRGLWNLKKKRFIVPPDALLDRKEVKVKLKEHIVTDQCYVIICGQTCESCFKIFQTKEMGLENQLKENEADWKIQITPVESVEASETVNAQNEMAKGNNETKSEGDMKAKIEATKAEEKPLMKESSVEKSPEVKTKAKRSSNNSLVQIADSQPKKSKSKASKRSRSPSIVVLESPVKEVPKKKNKKDSNFDVKIKPIAKVEPKKADTPVKHDVNGRPIRKRSRNKRYTEDPELDEIVVDEVNDVIVEIPKPSKRKKSDYQGKPQVQSNPKIKSRSYKIIPPVELKPDESMAKGKKGSNESTNVKENESKIDDLEAKDKPEESKINQNQPKNDGKHVNVENSEIEESIEAPVINQTEPKIQNSKPEEVNQNQSEDLKTNETEKESIKKFELIDTKSKIETSEAKEIKKKSKKSPKITPIKTGTKEPEAKVLKKEPIGDTKDNKTEESSKKEVKTRSRRSQKINSKIDDIKAENVENEPVKNLELDKTASKTEESETNTKESNAMNAEKVLPKNLEIDQTGASREEEIKNESKSPEIDEDSKVLETKKKLNQSPEFNQGFQAISDVQIPLQSYETPSPPKRAKTRRSKSFFKEILRANLIGDPSEKRDIDTITKDLDKEFTTMEAKNDTKSDSTESEMSSSIMRELDDQNSNAAIEPTFKEYADTLSIDSNNTSVTSTEEESNDENKPLNVALAAEIAPKPVKTTPKSAAETETEIVNAQLCNETKVEADQDMIKRMSMQLEAQKKMIEALLAAQRQDSEVKSEPQWWDHSAQREPLLVKLSWDEINSNITDLFPKVAKELENDEEFEDMLNFDQNVEDSGVTSDIVFRYFHLLEKVSHDKKIRAVRPFQFMSEPVKRRNVILKHKLTLKDYEDSLPQSSFENVDLILALVVMDLNREIPHFSLLVIDLPKREIRHYCSLLERLDTTNLRKYLKKKTRRDFNHMDVALANHQEGSYDCGLFVCQNAKQEALEIPSHRISQENMVSFRKMMLIELAKNIVWQWNE